MKSGRLPVTQDQIADIHQILSLLVRLLTEVQAGLVATGKAVDGLYARPFTEKAVIEAINDVSNRMGRFERSVRWVTNQEVSGAIYEVPWPVAPGPKAKPKRKARPRRK